MKEFDMKEPKEAEKYIGRNVVSYKNKDEGNCEDIQSDKSFQTSSDQ